MINPIAERWVGSVRRELLDHVVVLGERHLHGLMREYVAYYRRDRCHLSLGKDAPEPRPVSARPSPGACVVALPRIGGLHHRYEWRDAA
ncbi:MAG: integrase [Deltaproteobacteria bacterium]|nr:integrase [Deltaproteobacteria bacterium]